MVGTETGGVSDNGAGCQTDRVFRDRLRRRFDVLEAERADKAAQLDALEEARDTKLNQAIDGAEEPTMRAYDASTPPGGIRSQA